MRNPGSVLIALYARLTGRGKPHKAALIACVRKLLIYANTVVQRQAPWTENLNMDDPRELKKEVMRTAA